MQPTTPLAGPGPKHPGSDADHPGEVAAPAAWPPEQAVLGHLLDVHPRRLDSPALADELGDCLKAADVKRAIANLTEAGLVVRKGGAVEPARKVLEFEARVG